MARLFNRMSWSSSDAAKWLEPALRRPILTIVTLSAVALTIEIAQQWPQFFVPGHAIGEYFRNLAYALIGAVLFNWVLIEIPAKRRRRLAYPRHWLALDFLIKLGPILVAEYRGVARQLGVSGQALDAWDRESIARYAKAIHGKQMAYFGEERRRTLAHGIEGVQVSLDGLEGAAYFLDPDVAIALALFPAQKGLHQLQIPPTGEPLTWARDAHIVWELLEASRRLYNALQANASYLDFKVEEGLSTLSDGSKWHASLSDVIRESGRDRA